MDTRAAIPTFWQRLRARPVLTGGVVVVGVAVLGAVWFWFQPQTLLFDTVVDEEFPTVESSAPGDADGSVVDSGDGADRDADPVDAGDPASSAEDVEVVAGEPEAATGPVALAMGGFESRSRYTVTGVATPFELPDGSRTLRLEDFESTNGPDLYVYLTSADSADSDQALDDDFVDLGLLTGNVGNQNYAIPDGVDLDRYDTVVIWCLRFSVAFGAADLVPV